MKKGKLLNSEISYVISRMGHTDKLVIADAGLPIDDITLRIDLALKKGIPSFEETFNTIIEELKVEEIILATEIKKHNSKILKMIDIFAKQNKVKVKFISHEDFKKETLDAKAVVRTGEFSPYANVIFKSGVIF